MFSPHMAAIEAVIALAEKVFEKYESVQQLRPECRKVRDYAASAKSILVKLQPAVARMPNVPIGQPLDLLEAAMREAFDVLEVCASKPLRAKLYSQTYLSKLRAAAQSTRDAINLLAAANTSLSALIRSQVEDVQEDVRDLLARCDRFRDEVGDEMRMALREGLQPLLQQLQQSGLAQGEPEARQQVAELQLEREEMEREKRFAEQELLEMVCSLSLAEAQPAPTLGGTLQRPSSAPSRSTQW